MLPTRNICFDRIANQRSYFPVARQVCAYLFLGLLLISPGDLLAQMPFDGIDTTFVDGAVVFSPTCSDTARYENVMARYHYFWDFGNGDYSFERSPSRHYFSGNQIPSARLIVTNIKDDSPEGAVVGDPTVDPTTLCGNCNDVDPTNVEEALPEQVWACTLDLQPATSIYLGDPNFKPASVVDFEAAHAPKLGHRVKYAIVLGTDASHSLEDVDFKIDVSEELLPVENGLPKVWPENLEVAFNESTGDYEISGMSVPRGASRRMVMEFEVMAGEEALGRYLEINSSVTGIKRYRKTVSSLKDSLQYRAQLVAAWDPNFIHAYPGEHTVPGQSVLYHVQFENEGNRETNVVYVDVQLPPEFDRYEVLDHRFGVWQNPDALTEQELREARILRRYRLIINQDTFEYGNRTLPPGETGNLYLVGHFAVPGPRQEPVPEATSCGDTLVATMNVAFDNQANILYAAPAETAVINANQCGEGQDPGVLNSSFVIILVMVLLGLLLILWLVRLRSSLPRHKISNPY